MFSVSYDEEAALVVSCFSGSSNSDADYELYCASIVELNAKIVVGVLRIAILTVDSDNPIPNASWRKRIAEASADIGPNTLFILVTDRTIVRGILTAINWVRPPTHQWCIVSSFDDALVFAEKVRPDAITALSKLHDECRRQTV